MHCILTGAVVGAVVGHPLPPDQIDNRHTLLSAAVSRSPAKTHSLNAYRALRMVMAPRAQTGHSLVGGWIMGAERQCSAALLPRAEGLSRPARYGCRVGRTATEPVMIMKALV